MREGSSFFSRIPKWVYITVTAVVLLVTITVVIVNSQLRPYVGAKIKTAVSESTKGLYVAEFSNLRINIFSGTVTFDTLSLRPDTSVIVKLRAEGEAPKHIYQIDARGLSFQNISLWDVYFHKDLDMKSIVIYRPDVTITYNDYRAKKSNEVQQTAYQQLSKFLRSLHIGEIILNEANLNYVDRSVPKPSSTRLKGLNVRVTNLKIDSANQHDKSRLYYTDNIQLNLKDHKFVTADGLYTISIKDLTSSTNGKNLRLEGFRVLPNFPEMEFSRKYKEQHDRYDLLFREVLLTNIDLEKFNRDRVLTAANLIINGSDVRIFMNRELPPVSFDKGRNYPHVVIRRLKLNTVIDSILIKDTRIAYSEYNPKSKKKGTVVFDRFNAVLRNVTNDSAQLAKDHWIRARVSAWLMNKGRMDVNVNMDLTAENADFNFNGTLAAMDMRELNALSRNMSLAEIRSGLIRKAEFNVRGNWRTSSGTLKLYYNNLKVDILKNDEETNTLQKRGLLSGLANSLIIKNDNPDKNGELRIGKTVTTRINSASFFNLMWKSVFAGLKESVGFTLESPETQQVAPPDKKQQRKLEREKRREQRKKESELRRQ